MSNWVKVNLAAGSSFFFDLADAKDRRAFTITDSAILYSKPEYEINNAKVASFFIIEGGKQLTVSEFIREYGKYFKNGLRGRAKQEHIRRAKKRRGSLVSYKTYRKRVEAFLDANSALVDFLADHLLPLADEQKKEYEELSDAQTEAYPEARL